MVNEFYQTFRYFIRKELTQIIQYSFNKFTLASSQYKAMISLLYKKRGTGKTYELEANITIEHRL